MKLLDRMPSDPVIKFAVLLLIALIVPPVFRHLQLPKLIKLLTTKMVLNPDTAKLLGPNKRVRALLSSVNGVCLVFITKLRVSLHSFGHAHGHSLDFNFTAFTVPLATKILLDLTFKFN